MGISSCGQREIQLINVEGQSNNIEAKAGTDKPVDHRVTVAHFEKRNLCDGIYIQGKIEGKPILFTADTGASKTIISNRVFEGIEETWRPKLEKAASLKGAGGLPIVERGKATFQLKLGPFEIIKEAIVAEIEDDALLGYSCIDE